MSAAIIHVVDISSHKSATGDNIDRLHLAEAIRGLRRMKGSCIMAAQSLNILEALIRRWCQEVPANVKAALEEPDSAPEVPPICPTSSVLDGMNDPSSSQPQDLLFNPSGTLEDLLLNFAEENSHLDQPIAAAGMLDLDTNGDIAQ